MANLNKTGDFNCVLGWSDPEHGTYVNPSLEQILSALEKTNYRLFYESGVETQQGHLKFVGVATMFRSKMIVAIFHEDLDYSGWYPMVLYLKEGRVTMSDWRTLAPVDNNDIQAMNDRLIIEDGIDTVYYNDGTIKKFEMGKH